MMECCRVSDMLPDRVVTGHWLAFLQAEWILMLTDCTCTVHQSRGLSARWYVDVHKVSCYLWAVRAMLQ